MDPTTRRQASAVVVQHVVAMPAFARARSVLLYVAMGGEVDPHAIALHAYRAGKDVYLPASTQVPVAWARVGASEAAPPTADRSRRSLPAGPVVLIAPGIGFDLRRTRLGRGGGYYDRAIEDLRRTVESVVIGIGYDTQVVADLPRDPWDQTVDVVVTELRVLAPDPSPPQPDPDRPEGTR